MLTVVAVLAAPAAFGGAWLSFQAGIPGLAVFDIVAWVGFVGLATGRVPYRIRATALVLLFFVVGVVVLAVVGPNGVGHIWLTAAPMLAGLLFGRKTLVACLVAVEGSLVVVASVAIGRDWWPGLHGPAWWLMVGASIACIALLVGLPMLELLAGLEHSQVMAGRERDNAVARERAEAAERAAFTRLFHQTPAGLLLIDQTTRVVRSNHAALALFGDVLHPDVRLAALLGEDGHRAAMRACAAPRDDGALAFVGVVHGATVDGAPRTLDLRVVSLDVAGQRCALVGALDITARVAVEAELQRAHDEKVTLLQEVHHRVKNNLQIVSSMLSMQADNLHHGDAKQALVESTHRVRTMALIHQQLYAGDSFSRMNLAQYVQDLVRELCCTLQPSAVVRFDVVPAEVAIADALPLGLIINELVTNALKHGHSADGVCHLGIALRFVGEDLQLEVADQGQGLATPWSELGSRSLGVRIVKALVRQLRAKLAVVVDDDAGARFRVTLPPRVALSAADHDERGASAAWSSGFGDDTDDDRARSRRARRGPPA
jgi:two-component sensor histidine kinase/PAS domain-containing protein